MEQKSWDFLRFLKLLNVSICLQNFRFKGACSSSGKLAFGAAKAIFDAVKKPEVQHGLIAASENETARTAVQKALQDEKTLTTVSNIAKAYGRHQQQQHQQQQKDLINLSSSAEDIHARVSGNGASRWPQQQLYPSLPSSRDYAPPPSTDFKKSNNFAAIHDQLASLNLYQPDSVKKATLRPQSHHSAVLETPSSGTLQEELPHGNARYRFQASNFDELSIEPGDVIVFEKKVDDQWVYALNRSTNRKGIVPLVYIDVKIPLPSSDPALPCKVPFYARALFDFDTGVEGDLKVIYYFEIRKFLYNCPPAFPPFPRKIQNVV
ncbi:unnamed protein product [Gongylonema pulchrum]|uniref:SH3 domain-containing protein n=1 Tax=Gongylonema pulchrum TaxID=637853 RepID=A0A183EDA3_9BILA|nr:unnamed protein product [Gongylonema pulchrum]